MQTIKELCAQVRQTAFAIHAYHGLLINFGAYRFEIRKFAWNEEINGRKPKAATAQSTRDC
jgi:hypothetical protein